MKYLYPYSLSRMADRRRSDLSQIAESFLRAFDEGNAEFPMDVEKKDDRYIVMAELPGVKKEEITLDVEEGSLTLSVQQEQEEKEEDAQYLLRERKSFRVTRRLNLGDIDEEQISAQLQDGILRIELPLRPAISKKKNISIQ